MSALIIVDLQYDFLPGGSLAVQSSSALLPKINLLKENFEHVFLS
jgi:nicotinamidase/pyrazinamidase